MICTIPCAPVLIQDGKLRVIDAIGISVCSASCASTSKIVTSAHFFVQVAQMMGIFSPYDSIMFNFYYSLLLFVLESSIIA